MHKNRERRRDQQDHTRADGGKAGGDDERCNPCRAADLRAVAGGTADEDQNDGELLTKLTDRAMCQYCQLFVCAFLAYFLDIQLTIYP